MADYVQCAACGYHNTPDDVRRGIVSDGNDGGSLVLVSEPYVDPRVDADPMGTDHQGLGDAWGAAPHAATVSGTQQGQQASSSGRSPDTGDWDHDIDGHPLLDADAEVALTERLSSEATDLMWAANHQAEIDPSPQNLEWAREVRRSAECASDNYDRALRRRNRWL